MTQALFGLIGKELAHSFSPSYFKRKFLAEHTNADYKAFPIPNIQELEPLLNVYPNLKGLNVTIPYKEAVIPYLEELDSISKDIGAVNCIKIVEGKLYGYNTDVIGFKKSLQPLLKSNTKNALILGTGGASKAVTYVLDQLDISYKKVSRTEEGNIISYQQVSMGMIAAHPLIINTTPLGMYPDVDSFPPIPYRALTDQHILYDLVYNPEETKFIKYGKYYGAKTKNGLEMLELQAEASWDIWQTN